MNSELKSWNTSFSWLKNEDGLFFELARRSQAARVEQDFHFTLFPYFIKLFSSYLSDVTLIAITTNHHNLKLLVALAPN